MEPRNILAIEIGGTKLQLIVYSREGEVLGRWRKAIDPAKAAAGICDDIRDVIAEIRKKLEITHIGVGFGGPVDREKGTICTSHQVNGWQGFDLAGWLNQLTGLPVYLENDANVAALGEAHFGAGRNFRTVFYMTVGSGIGGGLVQDKQLYCGRTPGEAEVGHLRMDMEGATLESVCSGWAVNELVRTSAREHPGSILAGIINANPGRQPGDGKQGSDKQPGGDRQPGDGKQPGGDRLAGGEARTLAPALEQGCPVAQDFLRLVGQSIAWGLSHVVQSEERRAGKECVSTCRARVSPEH